MARCIAGDRSVLYPELIANCIRNQLNGTWPSSPKPRICPQATPSRLQN